MQLIEALIIFIQFINFGSKPKFILFLIVLITESDLILLFPLLTSVQRNQSKRILKIPCWTNSRSLQPDLQTVDQLCVLSHCFASLHPVTVSLLLPSVAIGWCYAEHTCARIFIAAKHAMSCDVSLFFVIQYEVGDALTCRRPLGRMAFLWGQNLLAAIC